jgi:acyl-CoA thioester hydrolase
VLSPSVTVTEIVVRPNDMDADRNVNNAVYFEYFHQARLEHLHRLGVYPSLRREGGAANLFAVAENGCRYRAPAYFGDRLEVRTGALALGQRSFTLVYQVVRPADGREIARGRSVQVWLDAEGRSTLIPDPVRELLAASVTTELPDLADQ